MAHRRQCVSPSRETWWRRNNTTINSMNVQDTVHVSPNPKPKSSTLACNDSPNAYRKLSDWTAKSVILVTNIGDFVFLLCANSEIIG